MAHAMREGYEELHAYAPGDGCIAFCWADSRGNATGRAVTRKDVDKFLSRKRLSHAFRNYVVAEIPGRGGPVLAQHILRVTANGLHIRDKYYTYELHQPPAFITPATLVLRTVQRETIVSVRHGSTLAAVCFYLRNEDALLPLMQNRTGT